MPMTNPLEEKFLAVADAGDHWTKSTILQLATEELVKEETHPRLEEYRKYFDWDVDYGVTATLEFDIAHLPRSFKGLTAEQTKEYLKEDGLTPDLISLYDLSEDPEFWIEEVCNVQPELEINNLRLKDAQKQSEYLLAKVELAKEAEKELVG